MTSKEKIKEDNIDKSDESPSLTNEVLMTSKEPTPSTEVIDDLKANETFEIK